MTWNELLETGRLNDEVKVTLIKPLRNGEHFKEGTMVGYKPGIMGGGWSNNNRTYNSTKVRYIKKPKVYVAYNVFEWGKGQYLDWVDVDNCEFEIYTGTAKEHLLENQ